MRNKYKLIILILFITLLTGCKTNYNIKIYLDGEIEETVTIQLTKEELISEETEEFSKSNFDKRVKGSLETAGVSDTINDYSISYKEDEVTVKIYFSYSSIEDYVSRSKAIHYLFENLELSTSPGKVKIISKNGDFFENNKLSYDESIISIDLPYTVTNTNSNVHDEDNNTYSWVIDEYFEGIEFEYNQSKMYSTDIFKILSYAKPITYFNLAIFVIVVSLLILIVYLGIKLFIKEKRD